MANDDSDDPVIGCLGSIAGLVLYGCVYAVCAAMKPVVPEVEPGYALPSKAKIETRDLRKDNHRQTVIQYDGKSYLLKADPDGQLYAVPFKIEKQEGLTAKIVPLTPEEPEVNSHGR